MLSRIQFCAMAVSLIGVGFVQVHVLIRKPEEVQMIYGTRVMWR